MTAASRASLNIVSAPLRQLHDYWDDRRAGRAMPARADLDPADIPRLLPNLILFDVEPGSERLKARLVGTNVVRMYGTDYTGQYLDEIDFGDRRKAILHDYMTCYRTKSMYVSEHTFWTTRDISYRVERLILPLSDDGETVTMLLSWLDFDAVAS